MALSMRPGLGQFSELTDETLAFIKQLGVDDFQMNTPRLPGAHQWEYEDLAVLKQRADQAGLRLVSLENVPVSFYDQVMLGQAGRDAQIEHMRATVRNMGRAGIPALGYHWMPNKGWRSREPAILRGGARATRFAAGEHDPGQRTHDRVYTEAEMWANYDYYLERILPVAEEAGVRLALHPDDPPVESLGGVARLFRSFAGFRRAMDTFDSPNHGLDFCMGCWSEMGGHDSVMEGIRYFGPQGKIFYIHFRDVRGEPGCFHECFIDEGQVDTLEVVRTLKEVGFDGIMLTDHVPEVAGDTTWGHRARAHAIGYIQALIQVVNKLY